MSSIYWHAASFRLLGFAFLLTFLSSFGQTFFIGLFAADLRAATDLDYAGFGTVYSAVTLLSAVCLYWAGAMIDRAPLPLYVAGPVVLLAIGCALMATARDPWWLAAGLLLLRFAGQGLLSHTAVISIARVFARARGKALAVALFGHAAGEAILPPLAAVGMATLGWPAVWQLAALTLAAALPLLMLLSARAPTGETGAADAAPAPGPLDATRLDVIRDPRFHLLLPTLLLPAFAVTGTFIHQSQLLTEKGWPQSWYAASFSVYAAAHIAGTIAAGVLIDRYSARRLMPIYLMPLGAACLLMALTDTRAVLLLFMAGAGTTSGLAVTIGTALWAELYGVTNLGAIRSFAASIMVVSSALAPAIFGWLIEAQVSMNAILAGCGAATVAAMVMARLAVTLPSAASRT